MTFKNILVPVDFSVHSTHAVVVAADLARRFEAKLTLLHVFQPPSYVAPEGYLLYSPAQLREVMDAFEKQLHDVKKDALAAGAVHVETKQLQGIAWSEITAFARVQQHDLIVMGTHGRTGLQHAILGSVAERVLRHVPCPVLVVRAPADPKPKR